MSHSEQSQSTINYSSSPSSEGVTKDGRKGKNVYETAARDLLQTEQTFLALLADINSAILNHLLQAKPSDQKGKTQQQQLHHLNRKFHVLWDQTDRNYRTLTQKSDACKTLSIQDVYIITDKDCLTEAHTQYFTSFTNFVTIRGFDQVAKQTSDYWKKWKKTLLGFLKDSVSDPSVSVILYRILHEPISNHIQQYTLILTRLNQELGESVDKKLVSDALQTFVDLQRFISQVLDEAALTKILWKSLGHKARDILCTLERRLHEDSKTIPITVSSGKSGSERVLLFDDVLVLLQGSHDITCYDLNTVWVDSLPEEDSDRNCLQIITPEEELTLSTKEPPQKVLWQWKLNQAIRQSLQGKRDFPLWGAGKESHPPISRFASYTFKKDSRFKNAVYEGEWNSGKPHGKGIMKWPDGQNYSGDFQDGLEDGFGICLIPGLLSDGYDCYKCHWKGGKMQGYGICEHEDGTTYKGFFKDNLRHGFGALKSSKTANHPFKYIGHWENNKKSGYGIWDDIDRGERYIGMWEDNCRHGQGIVVTQSGLCYQGTFNCDKMTGSGILLSEDHTVYEGEFTEELMLTGKGRLTLPNGFTLEGSFSNQWGDGLQANGVLSTCLREDNLEIVGKIQLDLSELPMEERWQGIYGPFREFLISGCPTEMEEFYLGFHTQTRKDLKKAQDYLFCHRTNDALATAENMVAELSKRSTLEELQYYLEMGFDSTQNPLGKLLKILTLAFQTTYSGVGANKHLLSMAKQEVLFHAEKITEFIKILRMESQSEESQLSETCENKARDMFDSYTLVLPLILPRFHPELYMLYMLYHEKEDALYWQGIIHLGLLSDARLLEFLDVQKHLWPLKDLQLTTNQRYSLVRDECFLSAIECFQKISTTADPRMKMETFLKTYVEIEKTVSRVLEREYKVPMDDLLPLLVYVVSRARIQRLGAELHLIRDMMDPCNEGGLNDFLLTALESCYQHLQKEEIRNSRIAE